MKKKISNYIYFISEFILFGLTAVASTGKLNVDYQLFLFISISMNIPFILTTTVRNKKDRLFGLIFSSLLSVAVLLSLLNVTYVISYVLYILALIALIIRSTTETDTLFKNTMYIGPVIIGGAVLLKVLNILDWNYFLYGLIALFSIYNITIMIILYYKGEAKDRGNWFYGFAGIIFFLVWISAKEFMPLLDIESQMYQMFFFMNSILLVPAVAITNFTFLRR